MKYTYNNEGDKETNLLTLSFPSGEKLFQEKKTYDASNKIKLNVMQFWNPGLPGWQTTSQILYVYDGNNLITETTQSYISIGWQNTTQIVYEYKGENLAKETTKIYNAGTMEFEITNSSTQELYEYPSSDTEKQTSQHWETGTGWVIDEIFEITYLSPGVPSIAIDSIWDSFTNMWEIERAKATYNMGLLTKVEFHLSDGADGWDLESQTLFEYPSALTSLSIYALTPECLIEYLNTKRKNVA